MAEWNERLSTSMRHSQTLRVVTVAILVLVLLIPVGMIRGLVAEREERSAEAVNEVSAKWGGMQQISGPYLIVPYTRRWTDRDGEGRAIVRTESHNAIFLAGALTTQAKATTELRKRGIYPVHVYKLGLHVVGRFSRPDFASLGVEPATVAWDRVQLVLGIADPRAIQERTSVTWGGMQHDFLPGTGSYSQGGPGIHAVVRFDDAASDIEFSFPLSLNGSGGVYFVPFGETSIVTLQSNFPHPSFQGGWLPVDRQIAEKGFEARWSIPYLGRGFPQQWTDAKDVNLASVAEGSRFGVDFDNPVDHYRMVERSVKYAGLFILLTFAALWLFEVRAAVRVHPIQFLMLGGALCLYYLLLLSLTEHIAFTAAYVLASVAVIGMITSYGLVILRSVPRAIAIGMVAALLYAYLYVLLVNEDYALLIGAIGLFAILALVMYATRRIDWYGVGTEEK
jgi:inner membrane protein